MKLKPIKTEKEYKSCLEWADRMFDEKVKLSSHRGQDLQIVLLMIKDYEDKHYPIPSPDPIEAIKLKMEEKGFKSKDLVSAIGSKSYVSQILNRKKPLTLEIAKTLHKLLGIPAEILLT